MLKRKIETSLGEADKEMIRDLVSKQSDLWEVIVKYLYDKANIQTRQLMNCTPEELPVLQEKSKTYLEMINDFGHIKDERVKLDSRQVKVQKVKDIWHYITGRDQAPKIIKK